MSPNRHEEIRARIEAGEPGCAQAIVAGQLVSYHRYGMRGFSHDHPMPEGMSHSDIMEAVILAVAQGRGRATARTFSVSFASMMIATRRAFDPSFKAEHAEADAVEALRRGGPDLFYR
ncbi:MAG: hypothetical protein WAS21_13325 [Geminicoccaceae bacterium]